MCDLLPRQLRPTRVLLTAPQDPHLQVILVAEVAEATLVVAARGAIAPQTLVSTTTRITCSGIVNGRGLDVGTNGVLRASKALVTMEVSGRCAGKASEPP